MRTAQKKGMTSGEMADPDCAIASDSGRLGERVASQVDRDKLHAKH